MLFDWFFKKDETENKKTSFIDTFFEKPKDDLETALWEIKEIYDLPTEEVADVVYSKRKNFDYIREKNKK